jgi:thioredoxin-like negative regulator of GroEL
MSAVSHAPLRAGPRAVERILAAGRPTVIVFETRRCAPCETLAPLLDALAVDFAGRVTIVRVDARQAWVAARHHLSFVPTLVFYDRGREQARIKGNPGAAALRAHVEFLLEGGEPPEPAEGPRHTLLVGFARPRARTRAPVVKW